MTRPSPHRWRRLLALLTLCGSIVLHTAQAESIGEAIYQRGVLPNGKPLQAERDAGMSVSGATAACVNCHRRSGLGMQEGRRSIPPIAGSYLFHPRAGPVEDLDLPFVEGMRPDRDPYTEATLARAIRDGVGADGKQLNFLMPHFKLNSTEMAALVAYLKQLSPGKVPGVTDDVLHFATIVTPDADPLRRQGTLDVLNRFFEDKNFYTRSESPRLRSSRRMMFKVNRHWQLHVWQLQGEPATWEAQLHAFLAAQPVFAVISGVGGRTWAPVQRFCEAENLPCLFPNVDLPVEAENNFDTLYFSRGVLLESQLIAHALQDEAPGLRGHRLVQIYRSTDVGRDAAAALASALARDGPAEVNLPVAADAPATAVAEAVSAARAGDVVVLWLRPADIAVLGPLPEGVTTVYMSGRMGGLDQAPLPDDWRGVTHMTYPFDLPARRTVQLDYPLGWFRMRHIPVVAEQVQADTYLACLILSDALNHMVDTFVRDYLVERIEGMLEHRILTGYYPRLTLAAGQRFASKGGYLVHFSGKVGAPIVADGTWIVS